MIAKNHIKYKEKDEIKFNVENEVLDYEILDNYIYKIISKSAITK